jgi:SpoVK/Ycf46/Vps4 family AAA+-type ATPase
MTSENPQLLNDFIQLARTALSGRPQDVQLLIHRASKRYQSLFPEMTDALVSLLQESPTRASPLRKQVDIPLPVDLDSRLQLLRVEQGVLEHNPIFSKEISEILKQVLSERKNSKPLLKFGLQPTKSILFTGPPGVGKTLTAKWIAQQLNRPLLILDLAAVMSSFLGRTGNNIRFVLDYAKNTECVLLLDELDAIAKRRDDNSEIGELKRLVTVLLQEIDDWPSTGLLVAATNHPNLLDPAIWRRFEVVLNFENPTVEHIEQQTTRLLGDHVKNPALWGKILALTFSGSSFSDIERKIKGMLKGSAISERPMDEILEDIIYSTNTLNHNQKVELACLLEESGIISQRRAHEITGIARETIRKHRAKISNPLKEKKQNVKA